MPRSRKAKKSSRLESRPRAEASEVTVTPLSSGLPRLLVDTREAAVILGWKAQSLRKRRVVGGGPTFIRRGRCVAYRLEDLEAWVRAQPRFSSTSDEGSTR